MSGERSPDPHVSPPGSGLDGLLADVRSVPEASYIVCPNCEYGDDTEFDPMHRAYVRETGMLAYTVEGVRRCPRCRTTEPHSPA